MFGSKIKLDQDLLRRCKEHATAAGYSSIEEFVHHALETALKRANAEPGNKDQEVLKSLKGLGYIE